MILNVKKLQFLRGCVLFFMSMIQPNLTTGHEILKAVNDLSESWVFGLDFKGL